MGTTKEINIKNRTYYFYNDIIDLDEFDESKIKIDKKDCKNSYEYKKKITEFNVIKSVNLLYLRIVNIKGQFKKGKDDAWYLVISDKDDVYKRLVDILKSIRNKITEKTWDVLEYDKDYMKIKMKMVAFIKMLVYERIDISDGIDVNKSYESKECTLCHYWYFLDKSFSYGPYFCDGYYNMMQKCNKLKNIAIIHIKDSVYRICFLFMSKLEAKKLMTNSNLIDKKVL